MDISYLARRRKNIFSRWKLKKRSEIVYRTIKKYFDGKEDIKILDIGACDGAMLSYIKDRLAQAGCFGIEPVKDFVQANKDERISLECGAVENTSFSDNSFDAVVLSSVLEHIKNPQNVLSEVNRILQNGGKAVLLTVAPGYERLAVMLKIKKDDHYKNFTLPQINKMVSALGLKILESRRLDFPPFYQLTVAEKRNG